MAKRATPVVEDGERERLTKLLVQLGCDATTLGYWARVRGLTLADVERDGRYAEMLAGDGATEFRDGWTQADLELLQERVDGLASALNDLFVFNRTPPKA